MNYKIKKINKKIMLNTPYYLEITSDSLNKIDSFILYDFNEKLCFFGTYEIKNYYDSFDESQKTKQYKIPISKRLFNDFLKLSIHNLRETNKNIFLALNGLEEWII
jgi:hypothetical protein